MTFAQLAAAWPNAAYMLLFLYVFVRLHKVEQKVDEERALRVRAEHLLSCACRGFEVLRSQLLRVADLLRAGRPIGDDLIHEIEATPPIEAYLQKVKPIV